MDVYRTVVSSFPPNIELTQHVSRIASATQRAPFDSKDGEHTKSRKGQAVTMTR